MEGMDDAAGLPHAHTGLGPAEQLPAVIELIDFARAVPAVDVFGGDLDAPRHGYAGDRFFEIQIGVVNLNAQIAAIGNIDQARLFINGDAMRRVELVLAIAVGSHGLDPGAILGNLDDARIAVAIADEHIVLRIPGDICFAIEGAHVSRGMPFGDLFIAFD